MRFRPCIDIHGGTVKQIVGSTLRDDAEPTTNFTSDYPSSWYARRYKRDRLPGGHVIMLGRGNEAAATEALRAYPGGLQAGGGITPENAHVFLDNGASHVIVTSYIFRDGGIDHQRLNEMARTVGPGCLVLDLSCRKKGDAYIVVTDRWQKESTIELSPSLFTALSAQCDEFLVHAAHVEGMRAGIDEELVALLAECAVKPVTYAGGVRSIDDLERVRLAGRSSIDVTIGSALDLFGGDLAYREVVAWCEKNGSLPPAIAQEPVEQR